MTSCEDLDVDVDTMIESSAVVVVCVGAELKARIIRFLAVRLCFARALTTNY